MSGHKIKIVVISFFMVRQYFKMATKVPKGFNHLKLYLNQAKFNENILFRTASF